MLYLRSLLFYFGLLVTTPVFALLGIVLMVIPFHPRYAIVHRWTDSTLWWLRLTCGLDWSVSGKENIPPGPGIIMCKHQSAWETMGLQQIFPPQVWLLKRELLWIPFFGWGLASLNPIAIDRGSIRKALRQTVKQGRARLQAGIWVVIFPEGTRVAPGTSGRYQSSGGLLAQETGVPVVPVAHNAGVYWSRNSICKRPGTIKVSIGPVIDPTGKSAKEITALCERWIEKESGVLAGEAFETVDNLGQRSDG
jgi:1-acyl-sn-glycerol-3-phosphate acyltransferase